MPSALTEATALTAMLKFVFHEYTAHHQARVSYNSDGMAMMENASVSVLQFFMEIGDLCYPFDQLIEDKEWTGLRAAIQDARAKARELLDTESVRRAIGDEDFLLAVYADSYDLTPRARAFREVFEHRFEASL